MIRKDKEIKDKEIINAILEEAEICRIAMNDGDEVYIVPMNFGYEDNHLYFHSTTVGKKIDLLKINNRICFEIDINTELVKKELICNWGMKYLSVIGKGNMEFISDIEEKKKGLDIIIKKYANGIIHDYPKSTLDKIEVFKVNISEITGKKSG